jgi:hypothetical protein
MDDDIRKGFTPIGARSLIEIAIYESYFKSAGEQISIHAFVLANDGGSMQRVDQLREASIVLDMITNNFTANDGDGNIMTFGEFCKGFCTINEPVRYFYVGFMI